MRVKECCEDSKYFVVSYYVKNGIISIERDDYSDIDGVNYCMFCGKKLEIG